MTTTFSSTVFARKFAEIRDQIRDLGVVHVESHNRLVGGFLSPRELENYERLKGRETEILKVGELPEDLVAELRAELARLDG